MCDERVFAAVAVLVLCILLGMSMAATRDL
jgi:hypothetical protein